MNTNDLASIGDDSIWIKGYCLPLGCWPPLILKSDIMYVAFGESLRINILIKQRRF